MEAAPHISSGLRTVGRIPVRNLWLLYLYAADLARFQGQFSAMVEEAPSFYDLVARILCHAVEARLQKNLSRGYRTTKAVLSRVRGQIDMLKTQCEGLLQQGVVACRFDDHTIDTPRNRLVRAALLKVSSLATDPVTAHSCRQFSIALGQQGVGGTTPSRAELSADRVSRHDSGDAMVMALSRLVFDLQLPTEDEGDRAMAEVGRDEHLVRKLFEKAVGNFLRTEFSAHTGWTVNTGKHLNWHIDSQTPGLAAMLPGMITDIVMEHAADQRRIVIDTKFTGLFGRSQYRQNVLKSGYIYQMYAYLNSQVRLEDPMSLRAEGILLHPSIGADYDEAAIVQGRCLRFMTVDLMQPALEIASRLRAVVKRMLILEKAVAPIS